MTPKSYIIENPYEARLTAEPIELSFKIGKEKRTERRKQERKNAK